MSKAPSNKSLRVALLLGGKSAEREISLASGIQVAAALERAGHRVRGIDPAEIDLVDVDWRQFDACFIALHGGAGEDGRVQRLLDSLHVPYTGSSSAASQLAMSKSAAKQRWIEWGVPTPSFVLSHAVEPITAMLRRAGELGYPLVVKPDSQGSSLGVGLARGEDELQRCVAESQLYDPAVLAESYVEGREFTVAVLGSRPLPILEIVSNEPLFTYQAKYHSRNENAEGGGETEETVFRFDTGLPTASVRELQQTAVSAAEALGTAGLVRVDVMLTKEGQPLVLELNTSPGMTEVSTAPRAAARAGLDLPALCHLLVLESIAPELVG